MHKRLQRVDTYARVFLRLALEASFLSAVADRFGLWGRHDESNVAWGDFAHFQAYTGKLNWFLPGATIPALAWTATAAEVLFGPCLIFGIFPRIAALLSGILLAAFALAMTAASSIKAPLDYSVFTASAAAFVLAGRYQEPVSGAGSKSKLTALRAGKRE